MRLAFAVVIALALPVAPAMAYENFIPLGHGYSPEEAELPSLNSERDQVSSQTDVYESEIYNRQRRAKLFYSDLNRFSNDQEFKNRGSEFIDY